jgi:hypothetical protein
VKIHKLQLAKTISNQAPKVLAPRIFKQLEAEFEKAKRDLIQNFEQHLVTKELDAGPESSNISSTLGGVGNLHGFIGFEPQDNPTQALRSLILDQIKIRAKKTSKQGLIFSIDINIPGADDIAAVTPLPWAPGLSWAEGIEKGLSGLGNYLVKKTGASRSGQGIQVDVQVRGGSFSRKDYMTKLLADFIKVLEGGIEIL